MHKCKLILEDGKIFEGISFGYEENTSGEIVFSTGMVGYSLSLTDPSYYGQILILSFPIIGIYGVPSKNTSSKMLLNNFESGKIHTNGLIVSDYSECYNHYDGKRSLGEWLKEEKVPGLSGIDTRELIQYIREKGSMLAKIIIEKENINEYISYYNPDLYNLVEKVSTKKKYILGNGKIKILVVDCGVKLSILRELLKFDVKLLVVPWDYDFLSDNFDGLLLTNGPGNPERLSSLINRVKSMLKKEIPIFGICLGNQILGLASGCKIYKMKFGNRSFNQPVIDKRNGKCYITSQNHGYAIDNDSLGENWSELFRNGNDHSNEGIIHKYKPFFSVQFHPEGNPGPTDTNFLFNTFICLIKNKRFPVHTIKINKKRNIRKILLLGSGGIKIGQAGEFDYSGSQAIRSLKEENVEIILINPNVASVQTSFNMANKTYFLPINKVIVEKIIKKEKPDSILLQFGGQTALNCGIELEKGGILKKYNVEVLGTSINTIIMTEDRELFNKKLLEINEKVIPTKIVRNEKEGLEYIKEVGYPVLVRTNFSLGGLGSNFASNEKELLEILGKLDNEEVTISKSLEGFAEIEYEIMRDNQNNCITVCNMENLDPCGIHTGDSIVVSPSLTINNKQYFLLRESSIKIAKHLKIIGECNCQFAINPNTGEYYVIEVNARLSRSSALASKAVGYQIAYIAAKLCLGKNLTELKNNITKKTIACFEPSLDYIVVKFPKWNNTKFLKASRNITTCMKSIGETMSIGRTFEEAFMKSLRSVYEFKTLFNNNFKKISDLELLEKIKIAHDERMFCIFEYIFRNIYLDINKLYKLCKINLWFLKKLRKLVSLEMSLWVTNELENMLLIYKKNGFSDEQIYLSLLKNKNYTFKNIKEIRNLRNKLKINPVVKQIDTLAAEYKAYSNYLYITYNGLSNDIKANKDSIIILGSGSFRIGSSLEFDWCSTEALRCLKKLNKSSIIINNNPETCSTDYEESDKLYFEELTLERILDIYKIEKSYGVIICFSGQVGNNLALELSKSNINILGTSSASVENCENRKLFSDLLDNMGIEQPKWKEIKNKKEIYEFINKNNFPVIIRPSYVLSGDSMIKATSIKEIDNYLEKIDYNDKTNTIVISAFIENCKEIEFDAVSNNGKIINYAISEHIEHAGTHSGDATIILPAQKLYIETIRKIRTISKKLSEYLNISGPFNIQFLCSDNNVQVIELNCRASRTFPFISKVFNVNFIELAIKSILNLIVKRKPIDIYEMNYLAIKVPMFSFKRLPKSDVYTNNPIMMSTGEICSFGKNKYITYLAGLLSSGVNLPKKKSVLISIQKDEEFIKILPYIKKLYLAGFTIYTTKLLTKIQKLSCLLYYNKEPNVYNYIKKKLIGFVINIPNCKILINEEFKLRRLCTDENIPLFMNCQIIKFFISSIINFNINDIKITNWEEYLNEI